MIERMRLLLEKLGVQLIKLDLPFRLNHVNCFLAEGEQGWAVIDAGLHNEATVKRWEQALAGKVVTDLYVTHYHPDHFGYIGGLDRKSTRLNSSHVAISYAVFCLKKKKL